MTTVYSPSRPSSRGPFVPYAQLHIGNGPLFFSWCNTPIGSLGPNRLYSTFYCMYFLKRLANSKMFFYFHLIFFSRIIITTPITLLENETDPFTSWPSSPASNWISPAPIPSSRAHNVHGEAKAAISLQVYVHDKRTFLLIFPSIYPHLSICQSANMRKNFHPLIYVVVVGFIGRLLRLRRLEWRQTGANPKNFQNRSIAMWLHYIMISKPLWEYKNADCEYFMENFQLRPLATLYWYISG